MSSARKRRRSAPLPNYNLDDLLARITPENTHPETDWGSPVGRECPNPGWDQLPKQARRPRK
ncbi:AbrB/MazE/SpoVT family DNA-binding domain-containing protein [Sinimarinibacterium thermocellulolyticum]|uniref:Uncharacterized protein n=1 Tax=Sinimarinibacterium thermocellulolyticum TaxID=3170016 RepID=A0ABV2A915_9GAMM